MYVINHSFTKLAPAIDFSNVDIDTQPGWCVLGTPPQHFASVHSASLVNAWYERVSAALAQPVQREVRNGHVRIQVLGTAIFDFDPDGTVELWCWSQEESHHTQLEQLPANQVVVIGSPYQDRWLDFFANGALLRLMDRHADLGLVVDYVEWIKQRISTICWGQEVQDQVRESVAQALPFDPEVLMLAQEMAQAGGWSSPLRLSHYNLILQDRDNAREVHSRFAQMIPLYAMLVSQDTVQRPWSQVMRQLLIRRHVCAAMWRLLQREGTQWMTGFLEFYPADANRTNVAIELLLMVQAFGTQTLVPAPLLFALMQLGGNPNRRSVSYVYKSDDLYGLCARLGAMLASAYESRRAQIISNAGAIFEWASDHWGKLSERSKRQITWRGLKQRIRFQNERERRGLKDAQSWQVPYTLTLPNPQVQVVVLGSALAIWEEGKLMHHCADKYIADCASGKLLMVSLRQAGRHHPLATATFRLDPGAVSVDNYSGFANHAVTEEVRQWLDLCCRQVQTQLVMHLKYDP